MQSIFQPYRDEAPPKVKSKRVVVELVVEVVEVVVEVVVVSVAAQSRPKAEHVLAHQAQARIPTESHADRDLASTQQSSKSSVLETVIITNTQAHHQENILHLFLYKEDLRYFCQRTRHTTRK